MKKKIGLKEDQKDILEDKINKRYDDYERDVAKKFKRMKERFLKVASDISLQNGSSEPKHLSHSNSHRKIQ